MIKNMLKRRKKSSAYLATDGRHRWSIKMTMKNDKLDLAFSRHCGLHQLKRKTVPVTIHTKSHQLPFNSFCNVSVLHNLPPLYSNANHMTRRHPELAYQFILFSTYSLVGILTIWNHQDIF